MPIRKKAREKGERDASLFVQKTVNRGVKEGHFRPIREKTLLTFKGRDDV